MIFVTVGAQMPFDRLLRVVDEWAGRRGRRDVFAQIGPTHMRPKHVRWSQFLEPAEFRERVQSADAIVAHAGMGSILSALEFGKPVVVMPRRGDLHETRNDHQFATARRLLAQGRVVVAFDESHLMEKLDALDNLSGSNPIAPQASSLLLKAIRTFIETGSGRAAGAAAISTQDWREPRVVRPVWEEEAVAAAD